MRGNTESLGGVAAVLGGSGFVGSALVRRLLAENRYDQILVVDDLSAGWKAPVLDEERVDFICEDVKNVSLADLGLPNPIYYLCAAPYVPDSFDDPQQTIDRNVTTLESFLEMNFRHMPQTFVYASSGEVYGAVSDGCASETDAQPFDSLAQYSPYAQSRALAEKVLRRFGACTRNTVVMLRLFNIIGPGATHPYFVPDMIRQAFKSDVIAHGNLDAIRDFVWIYDAVEAFIRASNLDMPGVTPINVCSGSGWTARYVLDESLTAIGKVNVHLKLEPSRLRPNDLSRLVGSPAQAWRILRWAPTVSVREAVVRTVDEYRRCARWPYEGPPASLPSRRSGRARMEATRGI
jgi:UDP-glucose 4-epimerase